VQRKRWSRPSSPGRLKKLEQWILDFLSQESRRALTPSPLTTTEGRQSAVALPHGHPPQAPFRLAGRWSPARRCPSIHSRATPSWSGAFLTFREAGMAPDRGDLLGLAVGTQSVRGWMLQKMSHVAQLT
jgi:hypothetical protein